MLAHSLSQVINLKVKITTHLDATITGFIYTYADDILVLRTSANKDRTEDNYRFINTQFIKLLQVLGSLNRQTTGNQMTSSGFAKVNVDQFQKKLNEAIIVYGNSTNPKATTNAHLLFEKLVEKWGVDGVRWQENDIVIKNEIRLTKPYTLGKNSLHKLKRNPIHYDEVRKHLREVWLEIDIQKRGG